MPKEQLITKVGIGVVVMKGGKILLGRRKGALGKGEYGLPGGHLEYMESFEECARREIGEETGIEIKNIRFLSLTNLKKYAPKHYVDIGLLADWKGGEPQVLEPEKCEGWGWYSPDALPAPLFAVTSNYIESIKTGKNYFDTESD